MQTIDRTVEILHTVGAAPSGLTLTEITLRLGLPKTTVYRMLQALVKHDFLRKDKLSKIYRLGPALLTLGANSLQQWDLRSIAHPFLQQLAQACNETVCLNALHKNVAICLETIESNRSTSFVVKVGRHMEFNCSASGKAILAFQPDEQIRRIVAETGLAACTSRSITDIDKLLEDFRIVRQEGYAFCDGELEIGVRAIAAPIIQEDTQVVGSVAIVAPAERLGEEDRRQLLPLLLRAAREISSRLGYYPVLSTMPWQDNRRRPRSKR
jgi:DNA-binding IclR family transcriptional regulator